MLLSIGLVAGLVYSLRGVTRRQTQIRACAFVIVLLGSTVTALAALFLPTSETDHRVAQFALAVFFLAPCVGPMFAPLVEGFLERRLEREDEPSKSDKSSHRAEAGSQETER